MAEDGKQVSDQNPVSEEGFDTRRTVIKGLASAAPVIMTLGSGEVLAMASNLQCITKPHDEVPPKCIGKYQRDGWLRRRMDVDVSDCSQNWWEQTKSCEPEYVTKRCLRYVNESGNFVEKPGYKITRSCYNSFLNEK